jgi:hypothetical protein
VRNRIGKRQRRSIENVRHNIGSVSSGSMREEDLIPAFVIHLLHQRGLTWKHRRDVNAIDRRSDKDGYYDTDAPEWDLEWLFETMDAYAPEGFYFGSNPGDGADYGYWLSDHFVLDFDGLKVNDLSEVPGDWSGLVLDVNDHGNMTLYLQDGKERIEMWGVV